MDIRKKNIPIIEKLLQEKHVFEYEGHLFSKNHYKENTTEQFELIKNLSSTTNAVMVVGLAKTGSHVILSMLDALGLERAEELGVEGGVGSMPFEMQRYNEAYPKMEQKMREAKNPIILPHCHLKPHFFPKQFKGKIIHITRDPRAVAASAYPFFKQMESMEAFLLAMDIKSVDDYAKHDAMGHMYWGSLYDYDESWKEYATKENLDIIFMKFEDIIKDKTAAVNQIANFVGVQDYNVEQVTENFSIAKTIERRRKKFEDANYPFYEIICYRKGESKSWREELSPSTLALYSEKYPDLE